jgi:hypothetical protein
MFEVNDYVAFEYNEKLREGRVDKVGQSYVTLEIVHDGSGKRYKSFAFTGIKNRFVKLTTSYLRR